MTKRLLATVVCAILAACSPAPPARQAEVSAVQRPAILLITLDTTRADHLGFEDGKVETPHLDALAARGRRFSQAYSTVPTTLPAHASMLTGLYPSDHGIHENARTLGTDHVLVATRLRQMGYATAAFVSGFPLARRFGLAHGFDRYDDDFGPGRAERRAGETTRRVLAYLEGNDGAFDEPLFLWIHYFDPHAPYDPPEPFRTRYAADLYRGEIAYMDRELGRLLDAFENRFRDAFKILVAGDHGEGRGDHGEALHGNLLYQGVMRVPLVIAGTGIPAGEVTDPVSIRGIFDTVLGWAGGQRAPGLLGSVAEVVLGEAMKPYLQYGWQPQVMAVRGDLKVIRSGDTEVYDLRGDPAESRNLAGSVEIDPELRQALRAYPRRPAGGRGGGDGLSPEETERLASLGYVGWHGESVPVNMEASDDAPSPREMTHLFADLDRGSGLFIRRRYDEAIEVFAAVLERDPNNLMVCVRLAVAHSLEGRDTEALVLFERAREIDPGSVDVRHYLGMHHLRAGRWSPAETLLGSVLAQMPERLPALEGMAEIRQRQGRLKEACELLERAVVLAPSGVAGLLRLAELKMAVGETSAAASAFERAREIQEEEFTHFLELGVLYLADRRLPEARDCLDQVPGAHPGYPMALFKRAQVSVLMGERDRDERIRRAYASADSTTRRLIENESLFRGVTLRQPSVGRRPAA